MKFTFRLVIAAVLASPAGANPLPAAQSGMKRWIVTFKPTVKRDGRDAALAAMNLTAVGQIATDGDSANEFSAAVVDLPAGQAPAQPALSGQAALAASFVSIEPDRRLKWIEQAPTVLVHSIRVPLLRTFEY